MLAYQSAGDIEQASFGTVNLVKFGFVRRIGDALIRRQKTLVSTEAR